MFIGTKQNVVAPSDYECLIWGVKETGPRGVKENSVTSERGHNQRAWKREEGKPGKWGQGFWTLGVPGTTHRKGSLPVADLGRMWFGFPKYGRIKEVLFDIESPAVHHKRKNTKS